MPEIGLTQTVNLGHTTAYVDFVPHDVCPRLLTYHPFVNPIIILLVLQS